MEKRREGLAGYPQRAEAMGVWLERGREHQALSRPGATAAQRLGCVWERPEVADGEVSPWGCPGV